MRIRESIGSRRWLRIGALTAGLALQATSLAASPTLDQSSEFQAGFTQFNQLARAQVFTVGSDGDLEAVEVFASQLNPAGNLLVSIFEPVDGKPPMPSTALPLATGSIPVAALPSSSAGGTGPAYVWIDLDLPLPVFQGEQLVMVVQKDSGGNGGAGGIAWFGNPGGYAGGEAWRFDPGGPVFCLDPPCFPPVAPPSWTLQSYSLGPFDFAFRTYLPEPTSGLMLGVGVAALAWCGRRARS